MNIKKIESYPYELKFNKPFKTAKELYEYRNGFIIKFFSNSYVGLGEVSPLNGFNKESAHGYSVYTSPGQTKSDRLADILLGYMELEFPDHNWINLTETTLVQILKPSKNSSV